VIGNEQSGDIFESTAQSLVVPVNICAVAGKGLAKAFALRFPMWLKSYQAACRNRSFSLRNIHVHSLDDGRNVVSLPTKLPGDIPRRSSGWIGACDTSLRTTSSTGSSLSLCRQLGVAKGVWNGNKCVC
jgi:hypothetical protein